MSAVAQTIDDRGLEVALVPAYAPDTDAAARIAAETAETNRWMLWFGLPALGAALSIGIGLGTGWLFMIGFAIFFIVLDILVLVWLAMTSDTNSGDDSHLGH